MDSSESLKLVSAIALQFTTGQLSRSELIDLRGCLDSVLDMPTLLESEKDMIRSNQFIPAIKMVRERTNCGLLGAKNACEYYQRQYRLGV
jgi:hypothetical protein